jgi:hypothetical protein
MRLPTLLLTAGLLALVFGLGFLLFPATLLPMYGAPSEPATVLMSRFFGVSILQLGLVLYLLREVRESAAQRGLVLAGVIGSAGGLVVALTARLGGLVNALGWSTVAIYGLLLLGYLANLRGRAPEM